MVKKIPLTRGKVALVSDEDYERVSQFKWTALKGGKHKNWYAYRMTRVDGKSVAIFLHRFILNAPKGKHVDHANRNGLDNRRENIRLASHGQNMWNAKKHRDASSQYKGVSKNGDVFTVRLSINGRQINFGTYEDEIHAARVYDALADITRGDFAHTNFPDIDTDAYELAKVLLANMPADDDDRPIVASFTLPQEHLDWIAKKSKQMGVSKSQFMRDVLAKHMERSVA